MDGKNINLELIERHYEGKLTADELQNFNQQVTKDEDFAQEVKIYEALMKGIDAKGAMDFETMVQGWEMEIKTAPKQQTAKVVQINSTTSTAQTRRISGRRRVLMLAAVVLALIVPTYFIFFNQPTQPQNELIFAQSFEHYQSTGIVRGGESDDLSRGSGLYSEKKYEEAISAFEAYLGKEGKEGDNVTKARFYLGMAQLATGQAADAIPNLQTVIDADYQALKSASEWYLALAYLKNNDKDALHNQLDVIINQPKHYKHDAAATLKTKTQDL